MREKLENLFRDWCFDQMIEEGDPISMVDMADFFDYVELMTDFETEDLE